MARVEANCKDNQEASTETEMQDMRLCFAKVWNKTEKA